MHFSINVLYIIIKTLFFSQFFYRIQRQPRAGGRGKVFTAEQEAAIVDMVVPNNAIRLREIQTAIIQDHNMFSNINNVSVSTIDRVLKRHQVGMKQLYKVPFERNSDRVKEIRYQYVQVSVHHCHVLSTVKCYCKM